jgi:hypothetical protein
MILRVLLITGYGACLACALSASPCGAGPAGQAGSTRWDIHPSEGLDAIAFLGALSGGELYVREYSKEAADFGARLPAAVRDDLAALSTEADTSGFGLLWPSLANVLSGTDLSSIDAVIGALDDLDARVLPAYRASAYWSEQDWRWVVTAAPRLRAIFRAMRDAGFAAYRAERTGTALEARASALQGVLTDYDVVTWQRRLTGRTFDPTIEIVLLYFSRPHGVKLQGQRFLQSPDYDITTTLRIAAHEMLHPPVPMDGPAATAALAVLARDSLMQRIVRDHDRRWGYTTLEGYLNEDLCQALDQLIVEQLSVARNPADRWRDADDGMHVLAAGLYGLLRQDKWVETGGSIESWLGDAVRAGRLTPAVLHPVAARVLERPVTRLWPLAR